MHYFGTKADLYTAAIDMPFVPSVLLPGVIGDTRAGMGERLARAFFNAWEDRLSREPLVAMLRGATTGNDQGVVAFREFIISGLLARIAPLLDAPDARLRLELAMSHMVGIAVIRYLVGLEPLASASIEEIVELVAPRIEAYLNP
jgi:AcrR family transcriptional regulator